MPALTLPANRQRPRPCWFVVGSAAIVLMAALAFAGCGLFGGGREHAGEACLEQLKAEHVAFAPSPVHASSEACTVDNPVRVTNAAMSWKPGRPPVLRLRGAVRQFPRRHRGVAGASPARASDHRDAPARHLFLPADGRRQAYERACAAASPSTSRASCWRTAISSRSSTIGTAPGASAEFLHEFARAACGKFGVVLTPDANSAHFNHIHIDASRYPCMRHAPRRRHAAAGAGACDGGKRDAARTTNASPIPARRISSVAVLDGSPSCARLRARDEVGLYRKRSIPSTDRRAHARRE